MASPFKVIEHVIPGQHIREYHQSIRGPQETPMQISIKQYIPVDLPDPVPENAVTMIGIPGIASPKEQFEPLWDDIYEQMKKHNVPLRAIWVADTSNQGQSGVLNEAIHGDQTSWWDHSRDLLHMVNVFRDQMPLPIVGVAHSRACAQLVNLAIMHPRLMSTMILYEPIISDANTGGYNGPSTAKFTSGRKDLWDSREHAAKSLKNFVGKWDPRVRERFLTYALRPVPTGIYDPQKDPSIPTTAVTLTTTRDQETWNFGTPNLEPEEYDRLLLPDWDERVRPFIFARPESWVAHRNLEYLRPSVFWVFGGRSFYTSPEAQETKMNVTGTGVGGSGGAKKGMVEKAFLPSGSHLLVFEAPKWCAEVSGNWLHKWYQQWLKDQEFWKTYKSRNSDASGMRLSEEAYQVAQMPLRTPRTHGAVVKANL